MEKITVAGAGFAGIQAAVLLARKGYNVEVIERENYHVYRPGIIDLVRDRCNESDLRINLEDFFSDTHIDFHQDNIESFRPEENLIIGDEENYSYDQLIVALGGSHIQPEGFEETIFPYSLEKASKLSDIEGSVAIIGAGYTGVEFAGELNAKGLDVTLFDEVTRPLGKFPEKVSEKSLESIVGSGIKFRGGQKIQETSEGEIVLEDSVEKFDHVLSSLGVKTNEVVRESFEGPIEVNKGLSSKSYDDIFAAGLCNDLGRNSGHSSMRQGKLIAQNISKKSFESLNRIGEDTSGNLVSIGNTGLYIKGSRVYESRLFRYAKYTVRKAYLLNLKRQRWMLKNLM